MEVIASFIPSIVIGATLIWKDKLIDHFKGTVIGLGFLASGEELNEVLDRHFADGKRAADFSGMIAQSALCLLFSIYLGKQYENEGHNLFERNALIMSSWVFFALYVYIGYKTMKIIVYFFIRDAAKHKTIVRKFYPVIVSIIMSGYFLYGQWIVVQAVARSNSLLK